MVCVLREALCEAEPEGCRLLCSLPVHLPALLSKARRAEAQPPLVQGLLCPREIAAEILLYSRYIRNAGNNLQTPNLTILMAIRA